MINADDYYGKHGFQAVYRHLASVEERDRYQYAMVGYQLYNTLTEYGHVARGVCSVDGGGKLVNIHERTWIEKHGETAEFTQDEGRTWTPLPKGTLVSMNMWGFTKGILAELEQRFVRFLQEEASRNPLKSEYFLPFVVEELLKEQKAEVTVLETAERWYGVTYKEDKQAVVQAIKRLKEQGVYTEKLWEE